MTEESNKQTWLIMTITILANFFLYGGLTKLDEQFFCFFFVFYMIESQFWDLMCTTVEQEQLQFLTSQL